MPWLLLLISGAMIVLMIAIMCYKSKSIDLGQFSPSSVQFLYRASVSMPRRDTTTNWLIVVIIIIRLRYCTAQHLHRKPREEGDRWMSESVVNRGEDLIWQLGNRFESMFWLHSLLVVTSQSVRWNHEWPMYLRCDDLLVNSTLMRQHIRL